MRTQDCREQIDWILEHCPIGDTAKRELELARDFCKIHPGFSGMATTAIMPLISEPDEEIREKAISHIENRLNRTTPNGGKYHQKITENQVREVIEKVKEQKTVSTFNSTNDNIEWAKWSWNPVTGCKHGCVYCYARDIANRFYKQGFEPTYHPDRLDAPKNTKVPEQAETDVGYKNVFVCSMADLFGDWVPQEWIDSVLQQVRENPQWNFLFLTKNPKRYVGIDFPDNAWVGTTVDNNQRVKPAIDAFRSVRAKVKFLSCEPLTESLIVQDSDLVLFDWIIIGGQSSSSGAPANQPEWSWVEELLNTSRLAGVKVYFKPNLTTRPKEYPGGI
jgi:protein gp37